jgi:hypothetical protein
MNASMVVNHTRKKHFISNSPHLVCYYDENFIQAHIHIQYYLRLSILGDMMVCLDQNSPYGLKYRTHCLVSSQD